ncbi:MAG: SDR family oxidoreductase, partial [Planctomycetales bacterium]|nr:SDR family oxidoreductase [Planctomycetales bacterium]
MGYYFLTGSTGLLGQFLLRDALIQERPLAVLVRPRASGIATDRVEALLQGWEERLQRVLPRPVVIEGSLTEKGLGLTAADRRWLSSRCETVVHSAASIRFNVDPRSQEPYYTNLDGTRHLSTLCEQAGLRRFVHVSTAYVCGMRQGTVSETELDRDQDFGNDYERSKFYAEQYIVDQWQSRGFTILRPSIIVGDFRSGYTSTFHGFYTPLQLAHAMLSKTGSGLPDGAWFLRQLGLAGNEQKNIVPVDWVSANSWRLMDSAAQNQTYHLTHHTPITVAEMLEAMASSLGEFLQTASSNVVAGGPMATQVFQQHMAPYAAYFRDDPSFDARQTEAVISSHTAPIFGLSDLQRLCQFALNSDFRSLPAVSTIQNENLSSTVCRLVDDNGKKTADLPSDAARWVGFDVRGPGGCEFAVMERSNRFENIE